MSTSTFDRPLVLTEKGVDNLIALMEKWEKEPPKQRGLNSEDQKEVREQVRRCLFPTKAEREETKELLNCLFPSKD